MLNIYNVLYSKAKELHPMGKYIPIEDVILIGTALESEKEELVVCEFHAG